MILEMDFAEIKKTLDNQLFFSLLAEVIFTRNISKFVHFI